MIALFVHNADEELNMQVSIILLLYTFSMA